MDVKYVNPFVESVIENFSQFTGITPEKKGISVFKKKNPKTEISAVIGITGSLSGSAVISFPKNIALKVASSMLMDEKNDINDEVKDAIGEFANISIGKARNVIVDGGANIKISPPTIIVGKDHQIFFPPNIPVLEVIFDSDLGEFYILVGLKEK